MTERQQLDAPMRFPLEAYPRLNIFEGYRNQGKRQADFLRREAFHLGLARLAFSEDELLIFYSIRESGFYDRGFGEVRLPLKRSNHRDRRPAVKCPGTTDKACGRYVQSLVWKGFFACAKCHGLLYGCQLGTRNEVALVALEAKLARKVGKGRPKGMHKTTYAKHVAGLKAVREKLEAVRQRPRRKTGLHYDLSRTEWQKSTVPWDEDLANRDRVATALRQETDPEPRVKQPSISVCSSSSGDDPTEPDFDDQETNVD